MFTMPLITLVAAVLAGTQHVGAPSPDRIDGVGQEGLNTTRESLEELNYTIDEVLSCLLSRSQQIACPGSDIA